MAFVQYLRMQLSIACLLVAAAATHQSNPNQPGFDCGHSLALECVFHQHTHSVLDIPSRDRTSADTQILVIFVEQHG